MPAPVLQAAAALVAGMAGGLVFRLLGLPLPWTLGAMAGAALLTLAGPGWVLPGIFRDGARPVIGVMAGSAFSPAVIEAMAGWWQILPVLVGFFFLVSVCGQIFFRKLCGFDRTTALFASMPGGLGEMTLLGAQFGADVRRLVLVHSVRIVVVVITIPFVLTLMTDADLTRYSHPDHAVAAPGLLDWAILSVCAIAGYILGRPLRVFGGVMIAAMLLSALAHGSGLTAAAPPGWLVAAMQVVIGSIAGARFGGTRLSEVKTAVLQGLFWTAILLTLSVAVACATAIVLPFPRAALFLALAPGGFAEMSIIAVAINIEVAFVVTCHVFRLLYIMLAAPILHHITIGWRQ